MYGFIPYIDAQPHPPEVGDGGYIRLVLRDGSRCGKNLICFAWDRDKRGRRTFWLRVGWQIGVKNLFRLA